MVVFNVYGVNVIMESNEGRNYDLFKVIDGLNRLNDLAYDSKEYLDLWNDINAIVDKYCTNRGYNEQDKDFESLYWELRSYEDDRYYDYNIDDFKAYEAKMDEPNFDWDFYSDWHKDIYGFRP